MNYTAATDAHLERVRGLFALYNERRFDEMLEHFCDDVSCFMPSVIAPGRDELKWSHGKEEYRGHLEIFYSLFGQLRVGGVFATSHSSSVLVHDEHGNTGTFMFEVTRNERHVRRVFFHHQPGRAAMAA